MQEVTMYKAIDGKIFDTLKKCEIYEVKLARIENIMSNLRRTPKDSSFISGHGFVQQNLSIVSKAMIAIFELVKIHYPDLNDFKLADFYKHPFEYRHSYIGRIIDDSGDENLYRAWGRFMNMDNNCREWGQGFFAVNPHEGIQIEVGIDVHE